MEFCLTPSPEKKGHCRGFSIESHLNTKWEDKPLLGFKKRDFT